jgi:hypothetical protein
MNRRLVLFLFTGALAFAQNPAAETSATLGGKKVTIKYHAPSVRGRKMFGAGGVISKDPNYPVWRLGAEEATALHTDGDIMIGNLAVPAGDYTLFVDTGATPWQLVVSKATGEWGLAYDKTKDLGRVPLTVSKPAAPTETLKINLSGAGKKGKLEFAFENVVASTNITAK